MMKLIKLITETNPRGLDFGLLVLRLIAGVFMITHGYPKLLKLTGTNEIKFMDFMGLGAEVSLTLVVFAEFFCSLFLALGLFTRATVIPLIVTMLVIIFDAHWNDPFGKKELPALYLAAYFFIFLSGAGKYSIDGLLNRRKR